MLEEIKAINELLVMFARRHFFGCTGNRRNIVRELPEVAVILQSVEETVGARLASLV